MRWTSIVAIYLLFWVLSAFLVMPFGIRTHEDLGERAAAGHAESAPATFRPGLIVKRATIVAIVLFGLYYLNYVEHWLSLGDFNFFGNGPAGYKDSAYMH